MRNDIQFLRGIAVLYVVFYHSDLGLLPQGFLGVDIFFVLSGFLITKLILEQIELSKFSFRNFYQRRVNRLLPALYVTLILTSLLSTFFLTSSQLKDFSHQLIGAVTFSANMVLPTQTGYFDAAAEGKPLLHIWSLSLEEQYYFLLPLVLTLTPKKLRLAALIAGFMASIYMCFSWSYATDQNAPFLWRFSDISKYEWTFYLLPTRAWELLTGSVTAWLYLNKQISVTRRVKVTCLSIILTLGYLQITHSHPNIEALIIVCCTAVILLGDDLWLSQNFINNNDN
ncbi:acyltransferase [Alteromonas sp. ALT199]|uniref:acyltransferase family protein n=1 Tax=unclassified Alteromonas TaxID=2614992 RepID=UPI001BE5E225|nr:acyltransferase [Alteromonas sp. ALT199]MBT3137303.1 acyltransferase [Alteromonas sp. ALT199]